mgnify:CR=1 FL=1
MQENGLLLHLLDLDALVLAAAELVVILPVASLDGFVLVLQILLVVEPLASFFDRLGF